MILEDLVKGLFKITPPVLGCCPVASTGYSWEGQIQIVSAVYLTCTGFPMVKGERFYLKSISGF